jgi:hypothetical protein
MAVRTRALSSVRRSIAVLIAMLCCWLSFCHQLARGGEKKAWEPGTHYFAQTFAHDWKCEVATERCVREERVSIRTAHPLRTSTVGLQLLAIGSSLASLLLALVRDRRIRIVAVGFVAAAWIGLVWNLGDRGWATAAAWLVASCPLAIACVLAIPRKRPPIAEAFLARD